MKIKLWAFALCCFVLSGCTKNKPAVETRSFYMAVTPWPADFTTTAVDDAYRFINQHCDMVSHHFDEGIPYEEAYRQLPWPQGLQQDVATRKQKTAAGKPVFLSVAALNLTRKHKADYYRTANEITDSIKNEWALTPINDPKVATAYVRYVSYLIDELKPQFVNFGVESNEVSWAPDQFLLYKDFLASVYGQLKTSYPHLPFFISFMVADDPAAIALAKQLVPYTDYISLSAYPYIVAMATADGDTDPKKLAPDFFTRFLALAPEKPWGFAETAYIAQDLSLPSYALQKKGTAQWQQAYLELICNLCDNRRASFLIWFCHADYDKGNERLRALGLYNDLFALWQDTGLVDETGLSRPAYDTWLQWMRKQKE